MKSTRFITSWLLCKHYRSMANRNACLNTLLSVVWMRPLVLLYDNDILCYLYYVSIIFKKLSHKQICEPQWFVHTVSRDAKAYFSFHWKDNFKSFRYSYKKAWSFTINTFWVILMAAWIESAPLHLSISFIWSFSLGCNSIKIRFS